ncbi:peptidoglycan-binding domain-containing protein [Planktothrix mougeotii]|uniref:Peptidoglycan-binding protein n=1 Tax=Planktothrix mougeotii LEGE 06226 TaxID=1828728 RepID=A0ABR9UCG8_9CYAN|nr:peptidoglycan-binding protein [Planktothrix mougeotii]MBE9144148.1 peptidoglycan-binding protein [Planktothrix mougeotii LEGE 06226]
MQNDYQFRVKVHRYLPIASVFVIGLNLIPSAIAQTPTLSPVKIAVEVSRPVLQMGSRGKDVSELQATLKLLGYYQGAVDGIYSEQTATAVSEFQTFAGLTVNGITDSTTWNRLFPPVTPTATSVTNNTVCQPPVVSNSTDTATAATTPDNPSFPILRLGMQGIAVTGLQERLKAKGFLKGGVDGVFGPETQLAVKAAQTEYKLKSDGVVGSETWMILLR